jgi:hypothetical protein
MIAEQSESSGSGDVIDLLLRQHGALRRLCEEVASAAPGDKEEPFRSLVRLMAVHEAVEEEIVHPYVKRRVGASAGVDTLLDEEREVKQMLVALDALGPSDAGFDALFDRFRTTLLAHASKEEKASSPVCGRRPARRSARRWPRPFGWPRRWRPRTPIQAWSRRRAASWSARRWQ